MVKRLASFTILVATVLMAPDSVAARILEAMDVDSAAAGRPQGRSSGGRGDDALPLTEGETRVF